MRLIKHINYRELFTITCQGREIMDIYDTTEVLLASDSALY